jgi:hypothetical protein
MLAAPSLVFVSSLVRLFVCRFFVSSSLPFFFASGFAVWALPFAVCGEVLGEVETSGLKADSGSENLTLCRLAGGQKANGRRLVHSSALILYPRSIL